MNYIIYNSLIVLLFSLWVIKVIHENSIHQIIIMDMIIPDKETMDQDLYVIFMKTTKFLFKVLFIYF